MKPNIHTALAHEPWSKGKLVGQKAPLKLKDTRLSESDYNCRMISVILLFSISRLTASYGRAIW
jgi:hypothetical protein